MFIGPARPLLHNSACAPLETICPLFSHSGALMMVFLNNFLIKLFLIIPDILLAILITVED